MVDWSNSSMGGVFAIPRITKNVRKVATDVGNFITSNYIDPTFVHCIGELISQFVRCKTCLFL